MARGMLPDGPYLYRFHDCHTREGVTGVKIWFIDLRLVGTDRIDHWAVSERATWEWQVITDNFTFLPDAMQEADYICLVTQSTSSYRGAARKNYRLIPIVAVYHSRDETPKGSYYETKS